MRKLSQIALIISLFAVDSLYGQTFRFNQYTTEDGISQNFIYSIEQDKKGYLWVGTGEGLCRFDGKHFKTFTTEDGLVENVITCSYTDEKGDQWIGHNGGGITKFCNDKFEGIKGDTLISKINAISGFGNLIYGVSQNQGLFEIRNNSLNLIGNFQAESFHAIECIDANNILIGTSEGLIHITRKNGGAWEIAGKYYEDSWVICLSPSQEDNVFLVATQNNGVAKTRLNNGKLQFSRWDGEFDINDLQIQTIMEDKEMNIWLGTYGNGLIKLNPDSSGVSDFDVTRYNTQTGMSSDYVQSVFQDREGNIWVGTFGQGISSLVDDYFTFYSYDHRKYGSSVSAIWVSDNEKWYGVENGLIRISAQLDSGQTFYNRNNDFVNDKVTAIYYDDSTLWIGTNNTGMFAYDLRQKKMRKIKWSYGSLQQKINHITGDKYRIWVATEGGLIVYYIENESTNLFDTEMGLAHNSIKAVCKSKNETIWMGTHSRFLYAISGMTIEEYEITNSGELELVDICETKNGEIWIATAENGVYRRKDDQFIHYSTTEGLKSNYTYAIAEDANGFIWAGHRGGLSKINPENGKIVVFDHKSGIKEQVNTRAMYLDEKGFLWIGTDGGAIKYDPTKDRKELVPPVINLLNVLIDETEYPIDQKIDLPYGDYRVQFNFIGISFKDPDEVKYKYKLVGYDKVYSDFTKEATTTYGRLNDGEYTFEVIACTEDDVCSEQTARIQIMVARPFWKKWWFYVLIAIAIIGSIILIVRGRVRRLRANQIYLEEQLAIKTKEVVEKAEIIQEINKDLTASINYAERIQSSILPHTEYFLELFPNSFIYFKPRDIVSGDFYFIREYDDRIIIACVDCTGHGVPGGFMSMIGATTLRNIYKLLETSGSWMTPDEVLDLLDEEVQKILHQKDNEHELDEEDFFKSRDGMDMTLCEINLGTYELLLASAKRHSIIRQDNEISFISGDKRPIGGGEVDHKDFNLQRFQMKPGDAIFLFSDGYSDQFGGPEGRKLKLSGVKEIITQLSEEKPEDYEKIIGQAFANWKGEMEQIDDVLMIGVVF